MTMMASREWSYRLRMLWPMTLSTMIATMGLRSIMPKRGRI